MLSEGSRKRAIRLFMLSITLFNAWAAVMLKDWVVPPGSAPGQDNTEDAFEVIFDSNHIFSRPLRLPVHTYPRLRQLSLL